MCVFIFFFFGLVWVCFMKDSYHIRLKVNKTKIFLRYPETDTSDFSIQELL